MEERVLAWCFSDFSRSHIAKNPTSAGSDLVVGDALSRFFFNHDSLNNCLLHVTCYSTLILVVRQEVVEEAFALFNFTWTHISSKHRESNSSFS